MPPQTRQFKEPVKGEMRYLRHAATQRKTHDEDAGIFSATITSEVIDRDGDIVVSKGIDLANYQKNPLVLFGHQYRDPARVVGRAIELTRRPKTISARWQFAKEQVNPAAQLVRRLWEDLYLNATSIGFMPLKWDKRFNEEEDWIGYIFLESELLEFSIVTVPANQDALRLGFASDFEAETQQRLWSVQMTLDPTKPEPVNGLIVRELSEDETVPSSTDLLRVVNKQGEQAEHILDQISTAIGDLEERLLLAVSGLVKLNLVPFKNRGVSDKDTAWKRPVLADFTDDEFNALSETQRTRIASHFAWSKTSPPAEYADLRFAHHAPQKEGTGPSVWRGLVAAMGRLFQNDMQLSIEQRQEIYDHLANEYKLYDEVPPEFRDYSAHELHEIWGIEAKTDDELAVPDVSGISTALTELSEMMRGQHA